MTERQYENFLDIAGPVSRETFNALKEFEKSFAKWAQKINLSSASTLDDVWGRHILDSAQLFPLVPGVRQWLDLGAGGGFPGLVVALMLRYERPDCRIDLVESNRKKAGFLQAMTGEYRLPARVHAVRIENAVAVSTHVDVVTARALAPLPLLLRLASPWLTKGATGLFHKGRDYRQELEESADEWQFDLVEHPSKTDAHGVILEIRSLAPSGLALAKPFNIKAL